MSRQEYGYEMEQQKVEQAALRYLNFRPRTKQEVRRYLKGKGYQREQIEEVITKIENLGYIDDLQFAKNWFGQRIRTKQKGKRVLIEELREKGVASSFIEAGIASVDEQEEWDACLRAAQKKASLLRETDKLKKKTKLLHYLLRRGFSYELVKDVYTYLEKNSPTDA